MSGQSSYIDADVTLVESDVCGSDSLYGIFLEDINFAFDGGLNSNLIRNYNFNGAWCKERSSKTMSDPQEPDPAFPRVDDALRYWEWKDGDFFVLTEQADFGVRPFGRFVLSQGARGRLINRGYSHAGEPAIWVESNVTYLFSLTVRVKGSGNLSVSLRDESNEQLAKAVHIRPTPTWMDITERLVPDATGYANLELCFEGEGVFDIGCVTLEKPNFWGAGEDRWESGKWRIGHLRRDIVDALVKLKPSFMRFPGGCVVEGMTPGNEYRWKETVGPLWARRAKENLWGAKVSDGGYCQSYQIGMYELFCLCEDLGAEPLPTLWAGLTCQFRSSASITVDDDEFQEVINDYLDLIEFANGDPSDSYWASLRRDMGHPAPFGMRMIGIGNENHGPRYRRNYSAISSAIQERYPEVRCVMSAYPVMRKLPLARASRIYARMKHADAIVDEHSYQTNEWFLNAARRYDSWSRRGPKVYVGEYAANKTNTGDVVAAAFANSMESAVSEAAYLTGVERNSDLVAMVSFAPLLNRLDFSQWSHDLINFDDKGLYLTANYFVQFLFSNYVGDRRVNAVGRLPRGVFISSTSDRDYLYIKLVNTNSEPVAVRLRINQLGPVACEAIWEKPAGEAGAVDDSGNSAPYIHDQWVEDVVEQCLSVSMHPMEVRAMRVVKMAC